MLLAACVVMAARFAVGCGVIGAARQSKKAHHIEIGADTHVGDLSICDARGNCHHWQDRDYQAKMRVRVAQPQAASVLNSDKELVMPAPSQKDRRRYRARDTGLTTFIDAFRWVDGLSDNRLNILIEGDSWFAYPKEWLIHGEASNVVTAIFSRMAKKKALNGLCLASNGDTAAQMMDGKQRDDLEKRLIKDGARFDACMFSAGGNDVVGPDDLEPLLNDYQAGFSAGDCINATAFAAKLDDIEQHFRTLIALRNTYAPQMKIFTHTYDILVPSNKGAEFLWGVEVGGPWILPTLEDKHIPAALHTDIVRILLESFRDRLLQLETQATDFVVVDTQGTLRPGHKQDWLNEIHPTPSGFNRIGRKIFNAMRAEFPSLPALPN